MFLGPEPKGCIQGERVRHGRCELLCQPDRVVPGSALGDEGCSEDTVGEQELNSVGHRGVESLVAITSSGSVYHPVDL